MPELMLLQWELDSFSWSDLSSCRTAAMPILSHSRNRLKLALALEPNPASVAARGCFAPERENVETRLKKLY
ncbi:hypothetical protein Pla52o_13120 [Novipirellula galeiformis]|uniref:Uncharacterized protein n=1 Tax=Novipirellula galeiformis TaxID=2528004 RepID=A0A5C6CLR5_9BACT|nr:hypothetical protein Pla52o_13120 [Novipirellula galeiformis]